MVKIYTRTGDNGQTSLFDGTRTSKGSNRVEAYGAIDELNAVIGLCAVKTAEKDMNDHFTNIQKNLHVIGANLAYPKDLSQVSIAGGSPASRIPKLKEESILELEGWIDGYENELPPLHRFILCGGTEVSALLHVARTVCRRAEREIVRLKADSEIDKDIIAYINRLSDYFFVAARLETKRAGKKDREWIPSDAHG